MRLSKTAYYADFAVYAALLGILLLIAATGGPGSGRLVWLEACAIGIAVWTLLEYVLHRFVLHRLPIIAPMHAEHHAAPRALIGTPTWLTLTIIWGAFFVPAWRVWSLNVASGLTGGVMAGFLWYSIVHHVIHHRRPQALAMRLSGCMRRHLRHHYSARAVNFGVTTALWDCLFGTAEQAPSPVPQRRGLR